MSTRPRGVRGGGREGKTKNKKQRGASPEMLKDLVHEGCNRRNGHNGPQPCDLTAAEATLSSVVTPQLNPPGGLMIADAILDLNFQRKCSFWASRSQNFACGAGNGYVTAM